MQLCEYGCGKEAIYQFKNGKWCCSKYYNKCSNVSGPNKNKKFSLETKNKMSKAKKNKVFSENHLLNLKKAMKKHGKKMIGNIPHNKYNLKKLKNSLLTKIEELRYKLGYEKQRIIQGHCKNHNCLNSKEKGGWFDLNGKQIEERKRAIENGYDGSYFYCCNECKQECPLFNLHGDPNAKKEQLYTSDEYQTWRLNVLEREDYKCEYCEKSATDVHHSRPQKLEPGFVLDPDFGVACCEKCHYKYGHKDECSTGQLANKVCK